MQAQTNVNSWGQDTHGDVVVSWGEKWTETSAFGEGRGSRSGSANNSAP
jgi:hypothetical protein